MHHAWLASALVPTLDMLKCVVARYKSSINLSPVQLSLQTPSPTPGSTRLTISPIIQRESANFGITENRSERIPLGTGRNDRNGNANNGPNPGSAAFGGAPSGPRDDSLTAPFDTTRKASAV